MNNTVILVVVAILVAFVVTGFQCATAEMTSGKMYIQRQDWASAEQSFEQEVSKHPENAEGWYWLGRVRLELKKHREMNEAFTRSLSLSKEFEKEIKNVRLATWGQLFNSGVGTYLQSRRTTGDSVAILLREAVEYFMTAIFINPDSASAYTNAGLAYLGLNDFDAAIRNFELSLERAADPDISLSVSGMYLDRGRKFQSQARTATGSGKDSLENLSKLNFDKSIARLESASRQWPENGEIMGTLLDAYVAAGRTEEATDKFKAAVEKRPNDKLLRYNYGVLLLKAGNHRGAVEQFEAAVVADPTFEDALYNLGVAYLQWGAKMRSEAEEATKGKRDKKVDRTYEEQFRKGKAMLERLRDMKPHDPDIWEALGQAYANLNLAKAASDAFSKADDLRKKK